MNSVYCLKVVDKSNTPNDEVIKLLRELLKLAKEGSIQSVAIGYTQYDEKSESNQASMNCIVHKSGWYRSLRIAVDNLQYRILAEAFSLAENAPDTELTDEDE